MMKLVRKFPGGAAGAGVALAALVGGVWYYKTKYIKPGDIVGIELSKAMPTANLIAGEVPFKVTAVRGQNLDVVYQPGSGGNLPPSNLMGAISVPRSSVTRIISHA
jgi:hypothetical protein